MSDIRCLYLENDPASYATYTRQIDYYWRQLDGGVITFKHVKNIPDFLGQLEKPDNNVGYNLVIADILLPPDERPNAEEKDHTIRGTEAIREAERKGGMLIVGISVGIRGIDLRKECEEAGAHLFFSRTELEKNTLRVLCEKIRFEMVRLGLINTSYEISSDDIETEYVIEEIGESNLIALYQNAAGLSGKSGELCIKALEPGLSGAFILSIEATLEDVKYLHLLKVSRLRDLLSREVKGCPKQGTYSSRFVVGYLQRTEKEIAESGGWYAICAVFEKDTAPLLTWLTNPSADKKVEPILRSLFLEGGLSRNYGMSSSEKKELSVMATLFPTPGRRSRIARGMKSLDELITDPRMGGDDEWEVKKVYLENYIYNKMLGRITIEQGNPHGTPRSCWIVKSHGDLHLRNILVYNESPSAAIIDTADFADLHWAVDYVRLLADMVLSGYDRGKRSHDWSLVRHWYSLLTAIIKDEPISDEFKLPANTLVIEAIEWLRSTVNISSICPAVREAQSMLDRQWELSLALGVELLRGVYRQEITTPKKIAGLLAAYNALSFAETRYWERYDN